MYPRHYLKLLRLLCASLEHQEDMKQRNMVVNSRYFYVKSMLQRPGRAGYGIFCMRSSVIFAPTLAFAVPNIGPTSIFQRRDHSNRRTFVMGCVPVECCFQCRAGCGGGTCEVLSINHKSSLEIFPPILSKKSEKAAALQKVLKRLQGHRIIT